MISFSLTAKPFISKRANMIEMLSEVAIIFILCTLLCCSDYIPHAVTRNEVGKIFIGIVAVYLFLHISILVFDCIRYLISFFKRKCNKKKMKQINELRAMKLKDAKPSELLTNSTTNEMRKRRPQLLKPVMS